MRMLLAAMMLLLSAQSANAIYMPKATPQLHNPIVHAASPPFSAAMFQRHLPVLNPIPSGDEARARLNRLNRKHELGWELFTLGILVTAASIVWLRLLRNEAATIPTNGADQSNSTMTKLAIGFIAAGAACAVVGISIALSLH